MQLDTFAKQLKFDLRMASDLPRLEEGGYQLDLEPDLKIALIPIEKGFAFRARVGKCTGGSAAEPFLELMLLGNLLGQGTGGSLLALDEKGEQILLIEEVVEDLPYGELKGILERFCNYAEEWKKRVEEAQEG
ncbi:MAG: type III secretion system chaperone [Candidatus Obscuribacterales bacterium]